MPRVLLSALCMLCVLFTTTSVFAQAPLEEFDKLWNYGDPAGTEAKFRELVPAAELSGDRSLHAQLLSQIARTQGLQGRFADAHATLDQAELLVSDDMTLARTRILLERGRTHNSAGRKRTAVRIFREALALAEQGGHEFHAVDAAHMLGIAEEGERSLEWNRKAIAMAESADEPRARDWLGSLYNNTGWTYHDMGEYDTALDLFRRALAFRESKGEAGSIRIAKWCVARAMRSLKRNAEALAMQRTLLAEIEAAGDAEDGYVFEEIGELLLITKGQPAARPYFDRAWQLLSADVWLQANEPERLARLQQLGGR